MAARRFAVLSAIATTAFAAVITDYACYTGSSLYERLPKVCNQEMSEFPTGNPNDVDSSDANTWFCSATKVTEMSKSSERSPPWIWSCATAKECNATCAEVDIVGDVPECHGYYGENGQGAVLSNMAGIEVKTWCAPAANNRNEPNSLMWPKGSDLPAALDLVLPFQDERHPTNAGLSVGTGARQAILIATTAAAALAALLAAQ